MAKKTIFAVVTILVGLVSGTLAEESWCVSSSSEWKQEAASADGIAIKDGRLVLDGASQGQWTSRWHDWQSTIQSAKIVVEAEIDLFDNKTIEVVVDGSKKPYTDADGVPHDWYGRCMIAIIDENRWIMALRSGTNHIDIGKRDTIHIITSSDEGRTWSELNRWFDGTPITGMPYEDGHTHSEPGLFRMPNGDLILQFWRTWSHTGTKQLRSTDNGKTWTMDIDRISVVGVDGADDDMAIGTEDYFVDPENPADVYMAFQYFQYNSKAGTLLARSRDNCKSYSFLSWTGPLTKGKDPRGGATFEPAIEYVGKRTIVAVMRGLRNRRTWQAISTNMGASFSPPVDISDKINGGVPN
ncbi:MAG: sialidase family protein, partial [Planctomycetota bacterium]|nr:sialidase family protein [Planctomycetota bacterium]